MKNQTNSTTNRRFAALTAPLLAAGILLGGLAGGGAVASAQPADGDGCAGMAMTGGQSGANPGALTRAGQVASAAGPNASDGSMAVDCQPASHG